MVKVSELKKKNYWNQILEQIELNSEYSAQNKEQNQTEKLVFSLDKTVCQIKCNTSSVKTSYAVFQLRHFRGLPLIQASA